MAMRDLVTGGAACAVPGSSSSSNPLGALANTLVGSSSKTQERLQEIPTSTSVGSNSQYSDSGDRSAALPGLESDYQSNQNLDGQGSTFLHGFRGISQGGLQDSWDEIHRPQMPYHHYQEGQANFVDPRLVPSQGPPQKILSNFLHSFVNSNHGSPFQPATLPALGLTKGDKQCIRDRSSIMARHIFGDKSEEFINAQVDALLSSLDIDNDIRARGPMPSRFRELDEYWNESQRAITPVTPAANGWVTEFSQQHREYMGPDAWAHQFEQQHGPSGWASEFSLEQSQMSSANQIGSAPFSNVAVMEQSRMIANTLAQDNNPKFQNSKFLNFVSKMSRGELFVDNNQLRSAPVSVGNDWATEYESYNPSVSGAGPSMYNEAAYVPDKWADEFASGSKQHGKNVFQAPYVPDKWADEFAGGSKQHGSADDQWVNEFSKLHVQDWADEFGRQVGEGALSDDVSDSWANAYDEYINEQVAAKQHSNSSRGIYEFSDVNPYVGHPDPLKEGQELFKKGLLSEAVLALEAEVLKNPENAEGWRLLGIAHAENDDDQQAISSLMRAQEVDPTNLEVLLALGVSHTNELEQRDALRYLYQWLRHHPKYGTLAPPELSDSLYHADIARVFSEAAQMSPEDADVHIVLGVLYNLSRDYDRAIESFKTALKLKPNDYSLWNKLAATQANSMQSADAVFAYQEALDLKPNYVRAWTNMGISYANQGMYEESVRYYVRALSMNPKADNAWNYLRISLSCDARSDMLEACDSRNLDLLQKEFPL